MTITLDEETARWARVEAARRDTSVSRLVAALLRERMLGSDEYDMARQRYFAQQPGSHRADGRRLPTREELHDRDALRKRS